MVNKVNNHLLSEIIEHQKDHNNIGRWKSRFWLETGTQIWRG